MKIFYLDLDTGKQYQTYALLQKEVPEANKHVCTIMLALAYHPPFIQFLKEMRKQYKIPDEGYDLAKALGIYGNKDSSDWGSLQAEIANTWHVTYWGEHVSAIASIILGNFVVVSIGGIKSMFFDHVKPSRIKDSSTYPAIVFDPNRNISKKNIVDYINANWEDISKELNKSKDKRFDFDEVHLEIYELASSDQNLTHEQIADIIGKRYKTLSTMTGAEVKSILQDVRDRFDYLFYNRFYR